MTVSLPAPLKSARTWRQMKPNILKLHLQMHFQKRAVEIGVQVQYVRTYEAEKNRIFNQ